LGVETIPIHGLLLAMYLSDTSLASCCAPQLEVVLLRKEDIPSAFHNSHSG
jgi:hypothetical protein